jgi:catechol 2,3-dioxygenase-like lactoylglutathione lyase family enzyme
MAALPPPYHVGIVVSDLDAARRRLTEVLGVTWGPVMRLESVEYRDADGRDVELPTAMCYSTGEFAFELIEETPGTIWVTNESSNLHHIGFWSERLVEDGCELAASSCPLELAGRQGSIAPAMFSYHRDEILGIRIELVDATARDAMGPLFEPDGGT